MTKAIDKMDKDELLDQTAILGIEADYSMSNKELREILNKDKEMKEIAPIHKETEQQRQEKIKTQY